MELKIEYQLCKQDLDSARKNLINMMQLYEGELAQKPVQQPIQETPTEEKRNTSAVNLNPSNVTGSRSEADSIPTSNPRRYTSISNIASQTSPALSLPIDRDFFTSPPFLERNPF